MEKLTRCCFRFRSLAGVAGAALFLGLMAFAGCEPQGGELRDMPYFDPSGTETEPERMPATDTPVGERGPAGAAPADPESVRRAAIEYVRAETRVADVRVEVQAVAEGWARVRVVPTGDLTDPATLYLRRQNGEWRGVVIGTAFMPEDLDRLGVPGAVRPTMR